MPEISIQYYKTPFGELILGSHEHSLCVCDWRFRKKREKIDQRIQGGLGAEYIYNTSDIISFTIDQLNEYFNRTRKSFDLPLLMPGTPFQKEVWSELLKIPYGKTMSYLDLSKRLGDAKAIRAVASANGANALSIIVPCHRVLAANGSLTGYAGGLDAKRRLLHLESGMKERTLF